MQLKKIRRHPNLDSVPSLVQYSKNGHLVAGLEMRYCDCVCGGTGRRLILPNEQMWLWKKERPKIEPQRILRTVWACCEVPRHWIVFL